MLHSTELYDLAHERAARFRAEADQERLVAGARSARHGGVLARFFPGMRTHRGGVPVRP